MVLLVTGTINPDSDVVSLVLKDKTERLRQYKEALIWLINNTNITEIVFCDNSNCPRENFSDYEERAAKCKKQFEYISFPGNRKQVVKKGKGYGEGEIIEYALQNSILLSKSDYFIKLTGRLKVHNINKMLPFMKYIMRINMFNPERVDTRLYGIPKHIYEKYFIHAYYNVNDGEGIYLEHVFTNILKKENILSRNLEYFPRYEGVSGSTGQIYTNNELKCKIRDMSSKFNKYGFKLDKVGK